MNEHYVVTLDQGHLRIYQHRQEPGQQTPGLQQVEAMDFPQGRASYTDRDTDVAGRFPGGKRQASGPGNGGDSGAMRTGMSIDERLPMQREEARRRAKEIAAEVEAFFRNHRDATWDLAAGAELNRTVQELLSPDVRERLRRSINKDLVNQRGEEVRAHFAGA